MISIDALSRAYNHVRNELCALDLLADGRYLDAIECELAALPSRCQGYVYDGDVGGPAALAGFRAGEDDAWDEPPAFDPDAFVSEYAATAPKEDFAETFMVVLRDGRRGFDTKPARLRRKLEAVVKAIEANAGR